MASNYKRKDSYYERAKDAGYRSRAAYKLLEINKKFKIIEAGSSVLELGCWPGGWLQVASELVGPGGKVVGIDLKELEPLYLANVSTLVLDAADQSAQQVLNALGIKFFDAVLSDMSPKLSGIREADEASALRCAELALALAGKVLAYDGTLVIKLFKSPGSQEFVKSLRSLFNSISREELDATRSSSNEFYVVARGFKRSQG